MKTTAVPGAALGSAAGSYPGCGNDDPHGYGYAALYSRSTVCSCYGG